MITVLVLTDSSLQVVIACQMENHYAKACMNYGLKFALSENIKKNRTKASTNTDIDTFVRFLMFSDSAHFSP